MIYIARTDNCIPMALLKRNKYDKLPSKQFTILTEEINKIIKITSKRDIISSFLSILNSSRLHGCYINTINIGDSHKTVLLKKNITEDCLGAL